MMCKLTVGQASLRRVIGLVGMGFALISISAVSAGNDNAAVMTANAAFYAALNKIFVGSRYQEERHVVRTTAAEGGAIR
jgi:hypothetical protein